MSEDTPIGITGRKMDVTAAMRSFIEEKAKSLSRFSSRLASIDIVLSVDGDQHVAEARVPRRRGAEMVAAAAKDDMYAAVDVVFEKIERQLQKHKEKLKSHRVKKVQPSAGLP